MKLEAITVDPENNKESLYVFTSVEKETRRILKENWEKPVENISTAF